MPDVFILGAGFSKAISDSMPTMAELSSAVLKNREKVGLPVAELHRLGNNIERWMTYLSQSQPWLKTPENDRNKGFAGQLREQIKEIIDDRTRSAARSDSPDWLKCLIRAWHERRATVITLNYDTLIERASQHLAEQVGQAFTPNAVLVSQIAVNPFRGWRQGAVILGPNVFVRP